MFTSSSLSLLLYVVESLLCLTEISRSITMGKCTFNELWLEDGAFSYWLKPVANNRYQAYCTLCKKALELSSSGIKSLQSHAKSEKHKVAVKGLQRVQVLFGSSLTLPGPSTAWDTVFPASSATHSGFGSTSTLKAEILWVLNTVTVVQGERRYCRTFPSNVPRLRHSQDCYVRER